MDCSDQVGTDSGCALQDVHANRRVDALQQCFIGELQEAHQCGIVCVIKYHSCTQILLSGQKNEGGFALGVLHAPAQLCKFHVDAPWWLLIEG